MTDVAITLNRTDIGAAIEAFILIAYGERLTFEHE
jgi:hypothetical protein